MSLWRVYTNVSGGRREDQMTTTTTTTTSTTSNPLPADAPLTRAPLSVYAPRVLPKIKRPVPINEKSKYDYTTKAGTNVIKPTSKPRPFGEDDLDDDLEDDDYYDEDYDELPPPPPPPPKKKESGKNGRRRIHQQERKRPSRYDEYDDEEEERPRMRKGNRKGGGSMEDDYRSRNRGGSSTGKGRKGYRDDDFEPIPSERPGYISSRGSSRKRYQDERPKKHERWRSQEYEYYDDEEEVTPRSEEERRRPSRPTKLAEKMRPRNAKKPTTTTTTSTTTTTTTTTPSTTTTTTARTTTETPSLEEEYEDYDEPAPNNEDRSRFRKTTTLEPHRFSTTNYKITKQDIPTTTEAIIRQRNPPVTYRRSKPDYRRPTTTTKQPEPFASSVGTPAGFKKSESDVKFKKPEPVLLQRRPYNTGIISEDNPPFRRPIKFEDTEVNKPEKYDQISVREEAISFKPIKEDETQPTATGLDNVRSFEEELDIKRPLYYNEDSASQLGIKTPDTDDTNPLLKRPIKTDFSLPLTGPDRRPDDGFKKFPRPGVFTPTAPDSVPVLQVYRRPFLPSPSDTSRRPNADETLSIRRPLKQESYSASLPTAQENVYRRPFVSPVTGEGQNSRRPDEQQNKRPLKAEQELRRPSEGMPLTAAGYRRGLRPFIEKEKKKTLEELAYPGRKTKDQTQLITTEESITERGPNYRNPFSIPRPVKEEQEYFKPPKTVEFTAPGPSGEGSTQRPLAIYDLEEEYDVTLNDALQPSTLNPTLQYARVKSRGYQSAVTHPSYHSLLLPSASQTFYSKTPAHSNDEYETVVLPAARFTQTRYKQRRPSEWYW